MARPRVLLTGFGPFPGVPDNPSGWLARALAARTALPDIDLQSVILPTEWESIAAHAGRLHASHRPHLMVHFGVDINANGLRLESAAHNRRAPRTDACGVLPADRAVVADGCDALQTRLPVASLAANLRAMGHAAHVSNSCGRYLCNDLYYRSLRWTGAQGGDALFVHIPLTHAHGGEADTDAVFRAAEATLHLALQACAPHAPASAARPGVLA